MYWILWENLGHIQDIAIKNYKWRFCSIYSYLYSYLYIILIFILYIKKKKKGEQNQTKMQVTDKATNEQQHRGFFQYSFPNVLLCSSFMG